MRPGIGLPWNGAPPLSTTTFDDATEQGRLRDGACRSPTGVRNHCSNRPPVAYDARRGMHQCRNLEILRTNHRKPDSAMTPRRLLTTDGEPGFGRHFDPIGRYDQVTRCLGRRAVAWGSLRICVLSMLFLLLATGSNGYAEDARPNPLSPGTTGSDTDAIPAQIAAYSQDLERLRRFMGAPKIGKFNIGIHSDLTRDLYFQTLTLWQKTDRLLFEISRVRATPPPTPAGELGTPDILANLQDAHGILQQIMRALEIPPEPETRTDPIPARPDNFTALLDLNRQVDLLLERHFAPSDVYMEITLAIDYAARLLARYPEAIRIPEEPPFEPNKQPSDVYQRLIACLRSIVHIAQILGFTVLDIDTRQTDMTQLTPGDVYMVASLVVSQLNHLYKKLGDNKPVAPAFYPGRKFPAHSYQWAGILQAQLQQLERFIAAAPTASGEAKHDSITPER